ncbi:MAG TPA: acetate--CoA ligase family protein [Galbitalea sp.]
MGEVITRFDAVEAGQSAIARLLRPSTVAIVGASDDVGKPAGAVLRHLTHGEFGGEIYPVNPRRSSIAGLPAFTSVSDLPSVPDVAVIAVSSEPAMAAFATCRDLGVPAVVMLTGGFGEGSTSSEGRERARQLRAICDDGQTRLVGPNSVGIASFNNSSLLTFGEWVRSDTGVRGGTALLTQSGSVGGLMFRMLQRAGIGIAHWISLGNELDLGIGDFLAAWAHDDEVERVALFVESVKNGPSFVAGAQAFLAAGKHIVLLKAADTEGARRAALSHTGKLAGSDLTYSEVLRRLGVVEASSLEEVVASLTYLEAANRRPAGRRVGLVSASGGICSLVAGHAEAAGLEVPRLTPAVVDRLRTAVPSYGSWDNPIDLSADVLHKPEILSETFAAIVEEPGVDTWLFFGLPIIERFAADLVAVKAEFGLDIVTCTGVDGDPEAQELLAAAGIPVLKEPAIGMRALARLSAPVGSPITDLPVTRRDDRRHDLATTEDYLVRAGLPFARSWLMAELGSAVADAEVLDFHGRVAVKILSGDIPHKSDVGCVRVDVVRAAVGEAVASVLRAARAVTSDDRIEAVQIQEMAPPGEEILVSIFEDETFGPFVMVGAGGIATEIQHDVAVRMLPIDRATVEEMISELRIAPLLAGFRGRRPADVPALVDVVEALVDQYVADPCMPPVELNPVIVGELGSGVRVVDLALAGVVGTA